ncbi:uncharacterized protein LOC123301701 [Chrysoperla carnea]|uniref:uncharacterized protein LOC123301701 n=1 Tax=Chrysoperla carnea TaxID=189513 RepID=UPI001D074E9D|nr:uncharacterized protein LOC123301701 [Chrysoperla carnea]
MRQEPKRTKTIANLKRNCVKSIITIAESELIVEKQRQKLLHDPHFKKKLEKYVTGINEKIEEIDQLIFNLATSTTNLLPLQSLIELSNKRKRLEEALILLNKILDHPTHDTFLVSHNLLKSRMKGSSLGLR